MKLFHVFLAVVLSGCLSIPNANHTGSYQTSGGWICSSDRLVFAQYGGGDVAYIHLDDYMEGGVYTVERRPDNSVVGKTTSGTFTCEKTG